MDMNRLLLSKSVLIHMDINMTSDEIDLIIFTVCKYKPTDSKNIECTVAL